jgi:hypothetical protein
MIRGYWRSVFPTSMPSTVLFYTLVTLFDKKYETIRIIAGYRASPPSRAEKCCLPPSAAPLCLLLNWTQGSASVGGGKAFHSSLFSAASYGFCAFLLIRFQKIGLPTSCSRLFAMCYAAAPSASICTTGTTGTPKRKPPHTRNQNTKRD